MKKNGVTKMKKTRHINPFASPDKYKFKGMPEWFKKIWKGAMKVGSFFHLFLVIAAILLAPIGLIVWFFTNFISAVNTDSGNVRKGCSKKTFYSAPFILALALMTVGVYKVSTISFKDVKNSLMDNAKNKLFKEITGKEVPVIPQRVKEYGEQGRDVADDIIDDIKDGANNTVIWMGENLITKDDGTTASKETPKKEEAKSDEKKSSEEQPQPKAENNEPDIVVNPTNNSSQEVKVEENKTEEQAAVTEAPKTKLIEPVSTVFATEAQTGPAGPEPLDPAIQQTVDDQMALARDGATNANPAAANNDNVDVRRTISFE